jgi:hypothetical protein
MDKEKKARLEAHGWTVGSVEQFLGLPFEAQSTRTRPMTEIASYPSANSEAKSRLCDPNEGFGDC